MHQSKTWGIKARERSKRRLEYFKEYQRLRKKKLGIHIANRENPLELNDSVGIIGEKLALKYLNKSIWIGKKIDLEWLNKRVDVKTSMPHLSQGKYLRWKFHLSRQKGIVDLFILFGLNKLKQLEAVYIVPDKEINVIGIAILIGKPSKYDRYRIPLS
jgi:hypothetical protein